MEGAMPNTPWTGKRTKRKSLPGSGSASWATTPMPAPSPGEETGGDQAQTTTEQQQTLVTEEAAQTEEKTVLPAPMCPEAASGSH